MGKGNVAVRQWISDKKRFADLFNGVVFQGRQIGKAHKEAEDKLDGAEFLSGFQKKDKIIPVITLVFYYDLKEWDGSVDLYGMFHWEEWGEGIELFKPYVSNYKINLVDAGNVQDLERIYNKYSGC